MLSAQPRVFAALVGAAVCVAVGCAEPEPEVPPPVDEARAVVEGHLELLDDVMVWAARERAVRDAIHDRIESESVRGFSDRVDGGIRYMTVVEREYIEAGRQPGFADEWGLTVRGERVLEMLEDADRHALQPETLHRRRIEKTQNRLVDQKQLDTGDVGFEPTVDEVEALIELVADTIEKEGNDAGGALIVEAVSTVDDVEDAPPGLRRFREYNRREAKRFADRASDIAQLELLVVDAALRYAREMRHGNLQRLDWRQIRDAGGSSNIIHDRLQRTLRDLHEASGDEIEEVFADLFPSHPQYVALLEATDRYRKFVEDGGWSWIHRVDVELGETSSRVEALRERLEKEGIEARPEQPGSEFDPREVDETLIDAVREYQRTHQFEPDGDPTPGFWRSINISADDRLAQMELTLQRWRESYLEDDENFMLVNIPRFKGTLWTDGKPQREFRVVVGNNNRRCDRETETWTYPDATPVMMAELEHVMVNPPWFVPRRIAEETLFPRLEENEDYFEENNYEEIETADGRELIRQNPGPENALGLVKFEMPNPDNIYMHDTPDKQYFNYGIRAFSHGCVRVQQPLELAEFLFDWEGRDDLELGDLLEQDRTFRIDIDRELPVFLEYYTVWVDDGGDPHFLADIYAKDERRLSDDPEEFDECHPPPVSVDDEDDEKEESPDVDEGEDQQEPESLELDLGP